MKRDWSLSRITILLYIIVAMIPLNYYFANRSFENMRTDSVTMQHLVTLNGAIQSVAAVENTTDTANGVKEVEVLFDFIDGTCIQASGNREYVALFRAQESFDMMRERWESLKSALGDPARTKVAAQNAFNAVNDFSQVTQEMFEYKSDNMLDMLYFSLVLTMLFIVALIFSIRFYIHVQIRKHAIHDHVTGLYNNKYFREALQKAKLFSARHNMPLSVITLSFQSYDELKGALGKRAFETLLHDFAKILRHSFRHSDTIARIEPNMFVVIVEASSAQFLEKIVDKLDHALIDAEMKSKVDVNIRQGYAEYDKESTRSVVDEAKTRMAENEPVCIGGPHAS